MALWDVYVETTATWGRTIRVEADTKQEAQINAESDADDQATIFEMGNNADWSSEADQPELVEGAK